MVSEDPTAPEDRDGACVLQPLCFSKKRSDIFFSLELLCSGIIFGLFNNLSTVFNAKNLHDQGYELAAGLSLFFLVFPGNPLWGINCTLFDVLLIWIHGCTIHVLTNYREIVDWADVS